MQSKLRLCVLNSQHFFHRNLENVWMVTVLTALSFSFKLKKGKKLSSFKVQRPLEGRKLQVPHAPQNVAATSETDRGANRVLLEKGGCGFLHGGSWLKGSPPCRQSQEGFASTAAYWSTSARHNRKSSLFILFPKALLYVIVLDNTLNKTRIIIF